MFKNVNIFDGQRWEHGEHAEKMSFDCVIDSAIEHFGLKAGAS